MAREDIKHGCLDAAIVQNGICPIGDKHEKLFEQTKAAKEQGESTQGPETMVSHQGVGSKLA